MVPRGPGLVLMGGGLRVDAAYAWMHDVIMGPHARFVRGGDIIVLRATGTNDYDSELMAAAPFNSVRTIVVGRGASYDDLAKVGALVDRAQGVFFSGGDQGNYARWKGTPLIAAVQRLYDRGGVVGGTSAGLAILGEYVFDSVAADAVSDDTSVTTANAVADPSESIISFTHGLLVFPSLHGVITDSHFHTRGRFGRLTVFLARLASVSSSPLMGVGVDEGSAIVIDSHGMGTLLLQRPGGSALFVRLTAGTRVSGRPFVAAGVRVTQLDRSGERFDFRTWCSSAPSYSVDVDGRRSPIYAPADPYVIPAYAVTASCSAQPNTPAARGTAGSR